MKLAWILWLSQLLPQPAADSLCLSTTVYLEARDQTLRGQQAVAEVALRRLDSGLWGDSMCKVVTARKQFAPAIVPPGTRLKNDDAWARSIKVALGAEHNWALPPDQRQEIVPGASHFMAHDIAAPSWRNAYQVATIGDHTFLKVQKLKPRS
ncbi:MAG: cell wall hydrolase [Pseudoxanthomonas sp.]